MDNTNPDYYKHKLPEPIDVIEGWKLGFHLGNAVKYIARWQDKGGLEDLKKARWYLDRFIDRSEKAGTTSWVESHGEVG